MAVTGSYPILNGKTTINLDQNCDKKFVKISVQKQLNLINFDLMNFCNNLLCL